MVDGLDTPWMGVIERISVYSYELWFAVFAVAAWRAHSPCRGAAREPSHRCRRDEGTSSAATLLEALHGAG
jgi:hypothetical protein